MVLPGSTVSARELPVILALAKHANLIGEALVKVAELARLCRWSEADVRDSIRQALKLKELEIFQQHGQDGKRLTNTYHFTVFRPRELNGDDITFEDPPLLGIPVAKVRDLPQEPPKKLLTDAAALAAISADPTYRGLNVFCLGWALLSE